MAVALSRNTEGATGLPQAEAPFQCLGSVSARSQGCSPCTDGRIRIHRRRLSAIHSEGVLRRVSRRAWQI